MTRENRICGHDNARENMKGRTMTEIFFASKKIDSKTREYRIARTALVSVKYSEKQKLYTAVFALTTRSGEASGMELRASDRKTIIQMITGAIWLYPVKREMKVIVPDEVETDWCFSEMIEPE